MPRSLGGAFLATLLLVAPADAGTPQPGSGVVDLPIEDAAPQRLLYREPAGPAAAVVLLLPGGDGVLNIDDSGVIKRGGNFLIRTRGAWLAHGFAIAIPDARVTLMNNRARRSYGEILERIVAHVRTRTTVPIWVIGTSAGSVAAANIATRLTHGEIAGLVLTSSLSRPGRSSSETVFGADLDRVSVPTLIVAHEGDRCVYTPPSDVEGIRRALSQAPRTEVVLLEGGTTPRTGECDHLSEHGFLGIEEIAVDRIAAWIKAS